MALQQFFYDEQIRRFLLQFTRMFSNFQVEYGRDSATGAPTLARVPIRYGDASKQAAVIIAENSANKMPNSPMMTFYITSLEHDRNRMQEPNWTTNTTMKLQLVEQLYTLFNPSMEIQSTDNFIDWTSLSVVELSSTTWSSRQIPMGTEPAIDISSMTFQIPIFISPPAKVTKMGVIHKIISSAFDANGDAQAALTNDDLLLGTRQKITPFGYQTILIGNQLQLIEHNAVDPAVGTLDASVAQTSNILWKDLVSVYGALRPGISQIKLVIPGTTNEVSGTVAYHPTDDRFLLFTVDADTVPTNTVTAINKVIDPITQGPGAGLAAAASGQRYLLLDDIGLATNTDAADAWGSLVANKNDIIQYDGTNWSVSFDASATSTQQFVTNSTTSIQYKWNGSAWSKSYQGLFTGGEWSLVI